MNSLDACVTKVIKKAKKTLHGKKARIHHFERRDSSSGALKHGEERDTIQILNLLNYTKTSGSDYTGMNFPAGYHTMEIKNLRVTGQRQPKKRLDIVPFDFTGKTVLDIGCNQGGMLFEIADKVVHGIGIDYDYRVINVANKIRSYAELDNLAFYVFNLEKEPLELIRDMIPVEKVDMVFLLAVCMWIKNWKQVIDFAQAISKNLLFESNGRQRVQDEQVAYLRNRYKNVQLLSENSFDDSGQKSRKLYLCN